MTRNRRRRERMRRARAQRRMCAFGLLALSFILLSAAIKTQDAWSVEVENQPLEQEETSLGNVATPLKVFTQAPEQEPPQEEEGEGPMEAEKIEAALVEMGYFRDDVPLTYEEQDFLHTACQEAGVPYALALAVIQKETQFSNTVGDDGASEGYMQVQRKWHYDRMERLGVGDLMEPFGNFRVGCDFLAELLEIYPTAEALTVYNKGHYPGYITGYANEAMDYYEAWKEVVGDGISGIKGQG